MIQGRAGFVIFLTLFALVWEDSHSSLQVFTLLYWRRTRDEEEEEEEKNEDNDKTDKEKKEEE